MNEKGPYGQIGQKLQSCQKYQVGQMVTSFKFQMDPFGQYVWMVQLAQMC